MLHARSTLPVARLTGVLAGLVLVAGCSHAAPKDVPSPATTAPVPSAAASSSASAAPSATPSAAPSSTSAQPKPSSGSDPSVEPNRPVQTAAPKKLDEPTKTAGAQVSLVSVRAASIKAKTPGDSSGPGVLIRLKMVNQTGKTLDTSFVQVNVNNDAGNPGTLVIGSPTDAITGSVKSGRSAEGTYAFLLDDATSAPVTVSVYVTSGQPVVTFSGRAS
jgi:cytoskeletal protein RodZ